MIKRLFFILFLSAAFSSLPCQAVSLKESLFVVETDEDSARQSLDRISGQIDMGFSRPEQTYESENHTKIDPLHADS